MKAISPAGTEIIGTLDTVQARAEIIPGTFKRLADGSLDHEWEGSTEVFWDDQRTLKRDGKDIYLDDEGNEWTEDQIKLVDEDETDKS